MHIWYEFYFFYVFSFHSALQHGDLFTLFLIAVQVCAAEKVKIQPCFVERFIGCCQGDIRKTIMHLQFWCQGQRCRKGQFNGHMK